MSATKISDADLCYAQSILGAVKRALGPSLLKFIWFGSKVRGEEKKWSDFEFVVVANFGEDTPVSSRSVNVYSEIGKLEYDMDLALLTEDEFKQVPFFEEVMKEGLVLYEHKEYLEIAN